jgi:hypothetical protein
MAIKFFLYSAAFLVAVQFGGPAFSGTPSDVAVLTSR